MRCARDGVLGDARNPRRENRSCEPRTCALWRLSIPVGCSCATKRRIQGRAVFERIVTPAARRYRPCGITPWQFARGKLRRDPVYRAIVEGPWLSNAGSVVDVGCGQGLMLALIAELRRAATGASGAGRPAKLLGIETRVKVADIARKALGGEAEIVSADARGATLPATDVVLLLDVLHMMPAKDQEALVADLVHALSPGGVLLMREADADAGLRFQAVNFANRIKALAFGYSVRGFHFRSAQQWRRLLEAHGLTVEIQAMGQGTPYGNVLLAGRKPVSLR